MKSSWLPASQTRIDRADVEFQMGRESSEFPLQASIVTRVAAYPWRIIRNFWSDINIPSDVSFLLAMVAIAKPPQPQQPQTETPHSLFWTLPTVNATTKTEHEAETITDSCSSSSHQCQTTTATTPIAQLTWTPNHRNPSFPAMVTLTHARPSYLQLHRIITPWTSPNTSIHKRTRRCPHHQ